MIRTLLLASLIALAPTSTVLAQSPKPKPEGEKPIRVLLITGGCCHDYPFQSYKLQSAAKERGVDVDWTIVNQGGNGTQATIELYKNPNWAEGYDVVIHNECFANTTDESYIRTITNAHKSGVNAVVIHCAMHTYRAAEIDDWREMLGVTSRRHEHKSEYMVRNARPEHPAMKDFPQEWTTPSDELYVIEKVWPDTEVLATSVSEKTQEMHPVIWAHKYGKARVFGTTYGHSNETFEDKVFLDTIINGMQWAAGRI
ncbi:MAG: ThuA domain-containing protein [Planctomycetaceae bacterium]|nr:ThuA domain-containing protein [Planctomycetaceae bacterium]